MATKKKTRRKSDHARARQPLKHQFPAHLRMETPEEWRALKRTEWREVRQALDRFAYGSAYVPAYSALYSLGRLAQQITEAIEAPNWIAW